MKKSKLMRLCRQRGMQVYDEDDEIGVAPCPYCGNDPGDHGNCQLNHETGQFHCWACDTGGSLEWFAKDILGVDADIPVRAGRKRHKQQLDDDKFDLSAHIDSAADVFSARQYLIQKRGLTVGDLYRYNVSVVTDEDHQLHPRIVFPVSTYWDKEFTGFVARTYTHQKPKYYNWLNEREIVGYRDGVRDDIHVLVEGLFDGIKVHKAGFGAAVMLGVDKTERVQEWAAMADPDDQIVILLDSDSHDLTKAMYWRIQSIRETHMVFLSGDTDPAEQEPEFLKNKIQEEIK